MQQHDNISDKFVFALDIYQGFEIFCTVKEVSELATILKEEYGIEPAAAAVAVAGPAAGGAAAAAEEKTSFDVVLKAAGANKLAIVKLVKELTGLGFQLLKTSSKEFIELIEIIDTKR